eukprot:4493081-Pleurochrysis_carterae.AAC.3
MTEAVSAVAQAESSINESPIEAAGFPRDEEGAPAEVDCSLLLEAAATSSSRMLSMPLGVTRF